ncbi:MAG TPA: MBL fold metallo-hydrolase [Baekduia sp.]|uniref:MBL fold metallo-hydrolase n=1 Tax=Baekduia sp. TaxID=2600305 RepID=UPI002D777B2E|nr:MBL fold metallo-hydrolase [Baekduia sp.]HET6510437.1 MBL fold metallo-hydrolase [Baekduia sp.]
MPEANRKREVGRGERVLPGVWRLRLPLPWPGVPHCNAWALAAGDGIVLVDCGMHEPGSLGHLERALAQVNLNLDLVRLLVCTHAHSDHYGQAATIVERTGCELWMHPNHDHMLAAARDPEAAFDRRIEVARQSGVPETPLRRYAEQRRGQSFGIAGLVEPDRPLLPGVEVRTDLGTWQVYETPGHAPSHVCLYQEERRILISGDHLLGRVSLYYDYGYSPDPAGEFLHSLDLVQELDARLCLAGHGRTFTDVQAHIDANRTLVRQRMNRVEEVVVAEPGLTAFEAIPKVYGGEITPFNANWWLSETLAYLDHLEVTGRVRRIGGSPERWEAAA